MTTPNRPGPDALLAAAGREGRGRLKIFLGAVPGVGKTFAMLKAFPGRAMETSIAPDLPLVKGDAVLLEQTLFDLLDNADQ